MMDRQETSSARPHFERKDPRPCTNMAEFAHLINRFFMISKIEKSLSLPFFIVHNLTNYPDILKYFMNPGTSKKPCSSFSMRTCISA